MAIEQEVIEQIIGAVKQDPQIKNHTHSAVVARVDDQGTVWVYVAGSDRETPTASTSAEVKQGDAVMVEWRNDRLYIAGNYSDPSAGAARVQAVEDAASAAGQAASRALTAAESAEASAETAATAAAAAVEDAAAAGRAAAAAGTAAAEADRKATAAGQAASDAQTSADNARASANNASEYAARALGNLSTVQSVTETLNWITSHGTMTLTTDTELDPTHVYFVQDNNGDYEVGGVRYAVVTEPKLANIGTYYELGIDESLNNYVATHLSVTSEGLWIIPDAGGNKVLIATGQGSTYTSAGTYIIDGDGDVIAKFGADGVVIGKTDETHIEMDFHSMRLVDKEGKTYFHVSDLRGEDGLATINETFKGNGTTTHFTVQFSVTEEVSAADSSHSDNTATRSGKRYAFATAPDDGATVTIVYKTAEAEVSAYTLGRRGNGTIGAYSVAEGASNTASGYASHAEGASNTASGYASHAEGERTKASGRISHAEGVGTTASGGGSHAEGGGTTASGSYAHAEGYNGNASGVHSHAEGNSTTASGDYAHAQNRGTIAQCRSQTALGEYNEADTQGNTITRGKYAVIVGNGTSETDRSNAMTVDWDGNIENALDTTAAAGTTDGDLYAAITALGWESEVID